MAIAIYSRRWFIILTTIGITIFVMSVNNINVNLYQQNSHSILVRTPQLKDHNWRNLPQDNIKKLNLSQDKIKKLSVLGRILYLDQEPPKPREPNKTYKILVWKYGKTIENRHMKHFGDKQVNSFEDCSVNNCKITYDEKELETADIVIFHLHRMKASDSLPKKRGSYDQIWAFLTDESPYHTFISKNKMSNYNGVFNWSMTYRMDSDIPVPYGRTVLRRNPHLLEEEPWRKKRKDVLVAILGSNCGSKNGRWDYVKELGKHIKVDVYGKCGNLKTCPGHFKLNCRDLDQYLFYLAFENSNCDEYITEKLWWNAFEKNSIPIVMGTTKDCYQTLLPPKSYLNIEEFAYPKDLAAYLYYLNKTEKYKDFYTWRSNYEVLNEHGYFQSKSYHYCRVCQALNYNNRTKKVYDKLDEFWSIQRDCHPAWNA